MARVILHCDANSFYASVELVYRPWLRNMPVAVSGDPEARHGIILTANIIAKKKYGIKTGEVIWQAKQKCPSLVCLSPDYPKYIRFSKKMRAILEQYSDRVESFGLDECWVDISGPNMDFAEGERIANEIRERIKNELGITVSIGVADNKVLAKLGSDVKKPDAVTVLSPETFREAAWPLPVSNLLYVGPATTQKLCRMNVHTIGELANCETALLKAKLGKNGLMLQMFALGADPSPVMPIGIEAAIKSVGHSITPQHDIKTMMHARCIFYLLAESVASRLMENGFKASCISINVRNTALETWQCQCTLPEPSNLCSEIAGAALKLFESRFASKLPLRSVGIQSSRLSCDAPLQMDLFGNQEKRCKEADAARAIEGLRKRFGHNIIQRGIVLTDPLYAQLSPKEDHTIHPVSYTH